MRYAVPTEETVKAMIAWAWTVELDSARAVSKAQIKRKVSKLVLVSRNGLVLRILSCSSRYLATSQKRYKSSVSVLVIVGPKCTLAALQCFPLASHSEYADGTDRQTDGRTPDRYITLSARRGQCIRRTCQILCRVENLCLSATVVCAHDGALGCHQQRWLSWKSVYHYVRLFQRYVHMTRGASHARCAIVETIATMRVQNYALSRIIGGSW